MIINRIIIALLLFSTFGCKTFVNHPKLDEREFEFSIDIINNETIALQYAELIFYDRYANVNFELAKPFEISSIENGKVWYVIAEFKGDSIKINSYHIKILKNTGQVLECRVIH